MTTSDAGPAAIRCPRCRQVVGDAERCPSCGLVQTGELVARLRVVAARLEAVGREQQALLAELTALRREQAELLRAVTTGAGAPPPARRSRSESRPEVVRDVLLWLGSGLVALAALIFALFAWRRLGDTGRAGLLFATTLLAAGGAFATRRRLPATAEALAGLTLALFLVDWFVLRRGGLGAGLSAGTWWAIGTGLAAALAGGTARWLRLQSVAAAVLLEVSAVLVVGVVTEGQWQEALGAALVSVPLAALAGRLSREARWRPATIVLALGAGLLDVGVLGAVDDLFVLGDTATSARLAAILAAVALAPAAARVTAARHGSDTLLHGLVAASAASVLGAVVVLLAAATDSANVLLAGVAVVGTAAVALARVLPVVLRPGWLWAAGGAVVVAVLRLAEPTAEALAGPLSWLGEPWGAALGDDAASNLTPQSSGDALPFAASGVSFLCLAVAGGLLSSARGGRRLVAPSVVLGATAAGLVGLVATAPLAVGSPIWGAAAITTVGSLVTMVVAAVADRRAMRRASAVLAGAALALAAPATGWALATEPGTLGFLAVVAVVAGATTGWAATARFRLALGAVAATALVAEAAAVAASAGASTAATGLVVGATAGALLAGGALWRHGHPEGAAVEVVGATALALGTWLAGDQEPWLAVLLTVAVPELAVAGRRPARRFYLWAATVVAVAATWAWLAVLDVTVVEAYTLPAAAVAVVAGAVARRQSSDVGSWPAFGPGLSIGLLPSLAMAVTSQGLTRPLAVTAASLAVLLTGARTRLQAPLVLGGGALVVVGLDALGPVAAQLPRWASIGTVGVVLLWLGATAEHRLTQLRELGRRFRELEPEGPLAP